MMHETLELERLIGAGGMGQVWLARHRPSGARLVLKTTRPDGADQAALLEASRAEVGAIAQLHHQGVVGALDAGVLAGPLRDAAGEVCVPAGAPYLLMEHVEGVPLTREADAALQTPQGWRDALLCALDALACAHARRIIHRDLKPENMLWASGATWPLRLIDFGVASWRGEGGEAMGMARGGTPAFAAPEQIRGDRALLGPWTDLYALGCVAWALWVGRAPFHAPSARELMALHLHAPRPAMADAPEAVEAWVHRMMAVEPAERFVSAAAAAHALAALSLDGQGGAAVEGGGGVLASWASLSALDLSHLSSVAPYDASAAMSSGWWSAGVGAEASPDAEASDASLPAREALPLPARWQSAQASQAWRLPGGLGVGVFARRAPPFVGREAARDALWASLAQVVESGQARAVVLQGPSGVGKTRLAMWLAHRAHEVGAAEHLRAHHAPTPGPAHGLGRMIAAHLGVVGLEDEALDEALRAHLRLGDQPPDPDYELRALRALCQGVRVGEGPMFRAITQLLALVERALRRLARGRALVLVLDDAQWGDEALALTRHLLRDDATPLPALLLLPTRVDALAEAPAAQRAVEGLLEHARCEALEIGPLPPSSHHALVRELLGLDGELTSHVVARTQGNPLFAAQLVGELIARGVLAPTPRGFALAEGARLELPEDIARMWEARLERALATVPSAERAAIEHASLLGVQIDARELRALCAQLGADPALAMQHLVDQGLATRGDGGELLWGHGMIVEAMTRRLDASRDTAESARQLLRMLDMLYPDATAAGVLERRGRLLLRAGELDGAIEALLKAGQQLARRANPQRALLVLDDVAALLPAALPAHDPRRMRAGQSRATALAVLGEHKQALALAESLVALLREDHDPALHILMRSRFASNLAYMHDARAEQALDDVIALTARHDADGARCGMYLEKAWHLLNSGRNEEALALAQEALTLADSLDDAPRLLSARNRIAVALKRLGRYEEALARRHELLRHAAALGDELEIASTTNSIADIARSLGRLDEAEAGYLDALRRYEALGVGEVVVAQLNLLLVGLQREQWAQVCARGDALIAETTRKGQHIYTILTHLLLAPACAALGRWDATRAHMSHLDMIREARLVDPDCAWPAALLAHIAHAADQPLIAQAAYDMACVQWEALGLTPDPSPQDAERGDAEPSLGRSREGSGRETP